MKLIILAAGDSFQLDGFNKILIRHPLTRETLMESFLRLFDFDSVDVVVGYKAMEVMDRYPNLNYIYNPKWSVTGNAYSLSLALTDEPCVVVSSDLFLSEGLCTKVNCLDDVVVTKKTENRSLSALKAITRDGYLEGVYRGRSLDNNPELSGVFKISDSEVLFNWKRLCMNSKYRFSGECLPLEGKRIGVLSADESDITEINSPQDFISLSARLREGEL